MINLLLKCRNISAWLASVFSLSGRQLKISRFRECWLTERAVVIFRFGYYRIAVVTGVTAVADEIVIYFAGRSRWKTKRSPQVVRFWADFHVVWSVLSLLRHGMFYTVSHFSPTEVDFVTNFASASSVVHASIDIRVDGIYYDQYGQMMRIGCTSGCNCIEKITIVFAYVYQWMIPSCPMREFHLFFCRLGRCACAL